MLSMATMRVRSRPMRVRRLGVLEEARKGGVRTDGADIYGRHAAARVQERERCVRRTHMCVQLIHTVYTPHDTAVCTFKHAT